MLAIPIIVGDLGRRLLDSTDPGDRALVLAIVVGAVLSVILLLDEIGRLLRPDHEPTSPRLGALVVPLTVAVATVILQRLLTVLQ
ncbi:MAG: hypothetical protein A2V85_11125 [Chloroflexi bacterium RBG_16_72_14]|nr:MAG: hypothetical protein A2V85_11125 [Chloroflexi bacterium RBG_16_72_14]